jgi:CSLREA domain-containing protein
MRTRVALAATIATGAVGGALMAPAGAVADASHFPPCNPGCTIVVNSTVDEPDANPGNGVCATAAGKCTLRAAVQEANASADRPPFQSKILVPPGTYRLTHHGLDDNASRGDLDLTFIGQVIGAGQSRTIVDGDGADRVFDLHSSDERIAHMSIQNGRATDGSGGGIRAVGADFLEYLNVHDNVAVPGEAAQSGFGGGIAEGDAEVLFSYISYNSALDGGGIWHNGVQSAGAQNDALVHNHATRDGGGLVLNPDDTGFNNLTISGNTAGVHGGGVFLLNPGTGSFVDISGMTIASNTASEGNGGGIWRGSTNPENDRRVQGLIVARNGGGDCAGPGTLRSLGGNLDLDGSCGFTQAMDSTGVDPNLGPVAYNGGPTPTRALMTGSPAINLWPCSGGTDQRGATRPQGAACDSGAFEVGSCCPASEPPYKPGSSSQPPGPKGYCGVIVQGTSGPDVLVGNQFRNELDGRAGNDRIFGKGNDDCLYGGRGNDFIQGGAGADLLIGGSGNDRLSGGTNEDVIIAGPGNDRLYGGPDDDRLYGGPGNDYIKGGDGYDTISGGPGNDYIDATGKGLDKVDCGSGVDFVLAKRLEHIYRCEHIKYVD